MASGLVRNLLDSSLNIHTQYTCILARLCLRCLALRHRHSHRPPLRYHHTGGRLGVCVWVSCTPFRGLRAPGWSGGITYSYCWRRHSLSVRATRLLCRKFPTELARIRTRRFIRLLRSTFYFCCIYSFTSFLSYHGCWYCCTSAGCNASGLRG